jgi:hypothetical protein
MRYLATLLLVGIAFAAQPPQAITCATGQITWLAGIGPARAPLLIHWDGRPVGGGSIDRAGHWALPLMVGQERPGVYTVEVRVRGDHRLVGAFQCAVGVAAPTAALTTPSDTPTPAPPGAAPITDTDCPTDHLVKGNVVSRGPNPGEKIYHLPGDNGYAATIPERCFATAAEAESAGYRPVK